MVVHPAEELDAKQGVQTHEEEEEQGDVVDLLGGAPAADRRDAGSDTVTVVSEVQLYRHQMPRLPTYSSTVLSTLVDKR